MLDAREKAKPANESRPAAPEPVPEEASRVPEINGPKGPEPVRYGDWERAGRCIDF